MTTALIIQREFRAQIKNKSFIWSTAITCLLIIAAGIGFKIFSGMGDDEGEAGPTIAVTEQASVLTDSLESLGATVTEISDPAAAVEDEEVDAAIDGEPTALTIYLEDSSDPADARTIIENAATSYVVTQELGGQASADLSQKLAQAASPEVVNLEAEEMDATVDPVLMAIGMATLILIYVAIVMSISMLAIGIVEEKSSRIVEILLATVKPRQVLLGKVLGLGAAILLMVTSYLVSGVIAAAIAGFLPKIALDASMWGAIGISVIWILLGFFMFAMLTGGLAATVSRQEELGAVTTPLVMLSLVPFYLGFFLVPTMPDALVTKVLSFIPFFAPFMMPLRAAYGLAPWEPLLAMAICLASIPLLAALAGKIYQRSILRMGERVKITQALRG